MANLPHDLLDVRPGDEAAVEEVEAWFLDYQATGDRAIRERIILAHLGLADRFHDGNGVAGEDLIQAARVPWSRPWTATTRAAQPVHRLHQRRAAAVPG